MKKIEANKYVSKSWQKYVKLIPKSVMGVQLFEKKTLTTSAMNNMEDSLYKRLLGVPDPKKSVVPVLDQWTQEERPLDLTLLRRIIRQLRKFNRIPHALQISEWMSDKTSLGLSLTDVAVQLDLIAKVYGVERAEDYFNNIPETSKDFRLYGALLNCYANAKLLAKAEVVMQKMRDLGYAKALTFNVMMNLYSNMGKHDKLDFLMQEMEAKLIKWDKFTYTIRLNAYASVMDIDGMEKLLMKMEADPYIIMDWNAYVCAGQGYLRAGYMEKALVTLRKSEQLVRSPSRKLAYEIFMNLYARMGRKDEVHRIWNLCKENENVSNMTYHCAINSLARLDDLDAAEKLLHEWEAKRISFDFRIPNLVITWYCKKGLLAKAESIVNRLIESGNEPNASTWSRMALGYHKENQMEKAIESLNKSIRVGGPGGTYPGWKPPYYTLVSCLEYLKEKRDSDTIEHIKTSLTKLGLDYTDVFEKLASDVKWEIAKENPNLKSFDQTERDEYALEGTSLVQKL